MLSRPSITDVSTKLVVEVIGAGYVGLVTAACLAALGHQVRCVDRDAARIKMLGDGCVPIVEPGLEDLVREGLNEGRLHFSADALAAAQGAHMTLIAVGTLDGTGKWTDANVEAVLCELLDAPVVPPLLVVRSTLRPGRMERLHELVNQSGRQTTLLVHPEFTKEGTAVSDFLNPDRIVVGIPTDADPDVAAPVTALYAGLDAPVLIVDHASAEMIKIGSNAFLATKVTFANELARFCKAVGADMAAVRAGLGLDSRIGAAFLRTGPGFGGSCLPSQVDLLASLSDEWQLEAELIPSVQRFNDQQPRRLVAELMADGRRPISVGVLGLAFKAGTDDLRESPAIKLIDALAEVGVREVRAFDPAVRALPSRPWVSVQATARGAALNTDLLLVATEWPEFGRLDWKSLGRVVRRRDVFDTRGVLDVEAALAAGFRVRSLERDIPAPTVLVDDPAVALRTPPLQVEMPPPAVVTPPAESPHRTPVLSLQGSSAANALS